MPSISVCIPTYHRPSLLAQALDSCFAQTFQDFDLLIGDDSVDDATEQMISLLPNLGQIKYFRNRPSLGQAKNVNRLFQACTSKYLVLLHDDDLLMPNALERMMATMEDYPVAVAAFGKQYLMTHEGKLLYPESEALNVRYFKTAAEADKIQDPLWSALVQQFPNDSYIVRTDAAKDTLYDPSPEVGQACDADFGFRLAKLGSFFFFNHYTGAYRMSQDSVSSRGLRVLLAKLFVLIQRLQLPDYLESTRSTRLEALAQTAVTGFLLAGDKPSASKVLFSRYYKRTKWFSKRALAQFVLLAMPYRLTSIARSRV